MNDNGISASISDIKTLITIVLALPITSCAALANQPPVTEAATADEGPTALLSDSTSTLTATSSAVPTSDATPTLPPPAFLPTPDPFASPIFGEFLLAPSPDPDCQLPCWQGLRIGESNSADVLTMFERATGYTGSASFLREQYAFYDVPDTVPMGLIWHISDRELFGLAGILDSETDTLEGIHFAMASFGGYPIPPPQALITALGTPSAIYIFGRPNLTDLAVFYEQLGIVSFPWIGVVIEETIVDQETKYVGDLCFDTLPESQVDHVIAPFVLTDRQSLPPILDREFGEKFGTWPFVPIQEVSGLTLDEIADIALRDVDPCTMIDYTYFHDNFYW